MLLLPCETVSPVGLFAVQRVPPLMVTDLFEDLKDGVTLLALLEVLSGQKLVSFPVTNLGFDYITRHQVFQAFESFWIK